MMNTRTLPPHHFNQTTVQPCSTKVLRLRLRLRPGLGFICPLALILLLLAGCHQITPEEAKKFIVDPSQPDLRREGIAALVTRWDFGRRPPYPERYKEMARHDSDVSVRAMAIRALNICRDSSATKIFIAGLTDDNEQIRLESAKALANVPDPAAIPQLVDMLSGTRFVLNPQGRDFEVAESKDVRIAAADALRQYRNTPDVQRSLVEHLNVPEFGVAWQCRQSLIALTGQDLKYDEGAWLKYLAGAKG